MQAAEEEHKRNVQVRKECLVVLTEALQTVELEEVGRAQGDMAKQVEGARQQQEVEMARLQENVKSEMELMQEQMKEYSQLQESLQAEMASVRARHQQGLAERDESDRIREKVETCLRDVLLRVEVGDMDSHEKERKAVLSEQAVVIEQLNDTIAALNEKNRGLLLEEESLRAEIEHCKQRLSEAASSNDDTVRNLQQQCDEQLQAIAKQKENNETLKAELKKRVAAMHAVKKDAVFSGTILTTSQRVTNRPTCGMTVCKSLSNSLLR
jgi:DNA repair exonuclease SbcCD ATPase subunit